MKTKTRLHVSGNEKAHEQYNPHFKKIRGMLDKHHQRNSKTTIQRHVSNGKLNFEAIETMNRGLSNAIGACKSTN